MPTTVATNQPIKTGAFICTVQSAALPSTFTAESLKVLRILDNGSNSHMYNSTKLSRFMKTRDVGPSNTLRAGTQVIHIENFGTVQITIKSSTSSGYAYMTLLNIAYVSKFMINLVSQSILAAKEMYFDSWKNQLHRDGDTIRFVKLFNRHYVMKRHLNTESVTFFASKLGTIND